MPAERLSMRMVERFAAEACVRRERVRTIARSVGIGHTTVAKYGEVRLEADCQRGLTIGSRTYGSIASALLLDREVIERENKRFVTRLRLAALRQEAIVEDVDLRAPRGWIAPCSRSSPLVIGSTVGRTCW